jgi:poly(A) polymerase
MKEPKPETVLVVNGFNPRFSGVTALDCYFRRSIGAVCELETTADIIALSSLFEDIEFPGEERIDALLKLPEEGGLTYAFRIADDGGAETPKSIWKPLLFYRSPNDGKFLDPGGIYPVIRRREPLTAEHTEHYPPSGEYWWYAAADAAVLAARYQWEIDYSICIPNGSTRTLPLGKTEQRLLLLRLLESPAPQLGFHILMETGFIQEHWPLLQSMKGVVQDKDFHPEGDVWDHTLEMYRHMKTADAVTAMGILVHDCGKAFAARQNNNEFDRHAQIGSERAAAFLQDLGFDSAFIRRVSYLVGNHMLTAHVPDIPSVSIAHVLDDPLFEKLLEIYRCDISSSFRDPERYYHVCEFYRKYKRQRNNPYRNAAAKGARGTASGRR